MPPKIGVHPRDDAFIHAMPAYLPTPTWPGSSGSAGYPDNQALGLPYIHGLMVLTDAAHRAAARRDGRHLDHRGANRGGEHAGHPGARAGRDRTIGIIGCGRQGNVHLELAEEVFPTLTRASALRPPSRARRGARPRAPRARRRRRSAAEEVAAGADLVITTAAIVHRPERPLRREHLAGRRSPARSTSTRRCPRTCSRTRRLRGRRPGPVPLLPPAGLLRRLSGGRRRARRRAGGRGPAAATAYGCTSRSASRSRTSRWPRRSTGGRPRRASAASCRSSRSGAPSCAAPPLATGRPRRRSGTPPAAGRSPRSRSSRGGPARRAGGAG